MRVGGIGSPRTMIKRAYILVNKGRWVSSNASGQKYFVPDVNKSIKH